MIFITCWEYEGLRESTRLRFSSFCSISLYVKVISDRRSEQFDGSVYARRILDKVGSKPRSLLREWGSCPMRIERFLCRSSWRGGLRETRKYYDEFIKQLTSNLTKPLRVRVRRVKRVRALWRTCPVVFALIFFSLFFFYFFVNILCRDWNSSKSE